MTQPNDLIVAKVDRARALLAQAVDAVSAKRVADMARAAEVYARRQKLSEETIKYAEEIRIDAMTLLGEFLKKPGAKNKGANGSRVTGNRQEPVRDATPTLADLGISKKESSTAQTLADIKEQAPELHEQVRAKKVTVAQATREMARR
jgi:hypothetical protein